MSSSSNSSNSSGGIGFLGLLTIVFITLKLTNYIAWSWWWVLAPLWFPIAIFVPIFLCVGAFFLYEEATGYKKTTKIVKRLVS